MPPQKIEQEHNVVRLPAAWADENNRHMTLTAGARTLIHLAPWQFFAVQTASAPAWFYYDERGKTGNWQNDGWQNDGETR